MTDTTGRLLRPLDGPLGMRSWYAAASRSLKFFDVRRKDFAMGPFAPPSPGSGSTTREPSCLGFRYYLASGRGPAFLAALSGMRFRTRPGETKSADNRPGEHEAGGLTLSSARSLLRKLGYEMEVRCDSHIHAVHIVSPELHDERHLCGIEALPLLDASAFCRLLTEAFAQPRLTTPSGQLWQQAGRLRSRSSQGEGIHE